MPDPPVNEASCERNRVTSTPELALGTLLICEAEKRCAGLRHPPLPVDEHMQERVLGERGQGSSAASGIAGLSREGTAPKEPYLTRQSHANDSAPT